MAEFDRLWEIAVEVGHEWGPHGKVVSVVQIVSPGNKGSGAEFRNLVEKSAVHLVYPKSDPSKYANINAFLIAKLKP